MYVERLHLTRSFSFIPVTGSDEEHDLHVHDCLEIGVLLRGELTYRFGDRTYAGRPGDAFLCRPFEPHWSYAKPGETFGAILILFTPSAVRAVPGGSRLLVPFYAGRGLAPLLPASSPRAARIREAAEAAVRAKEAGEAAAETRQFAALLGILLEVHDFAAESAGAAGPGAAAGAGRRAGAEAASAGNALPQTEIADSVGYLLDRYREAVDGEALARQSGMGKSRYFEQFRLLTGASPHELVVRLRVQDAMDLLRTTDLSVIEIAERSGFQSLSAFNKQFKAYCGVSPRGYRNGR
ncbi:helix-turn-helix transcriptional regulator [Paenibacillus sp. MWE-103]|uniref:Helix-turn-helix transcriptional regulator n=1 Tax=Paenibacillus artemisiicola TaxID=1172618 RepID=A0ABS3WC82_9BACL|nr:AraC family transcriptional regulator [Paenibacillus artemisiicola]MBO7745922.1 helix-turn-helix transcriptional regulator [Paenibacillus artemisiicola]